jgi:hypothetical protein
VNLLRGILAPGRIAGLPRSLRGTGIDQNQMSTVARTHFQQSCSDNVYAVTQPAVTPARPLYNLAPQVTHHDIQKTGTAASMQKLGQRERGYSRRAMAFQRLVDRRRRFARHRVVLGKGGSGSLVRPSLRYIFSEPIIMANFLLGDQSSRIGPARR